MRNQNCYSICVLFIMFALIATWSYGGETGTFKEAEIPTASPNPDKQPSAEAPVTEIISTGDNQWALWLPMDSQLGVATAINTLAKDFNVNRIWWRGGQDDMWLDNFKIRPENRFIYEYWDWMRYLNKKAGTNEAAIRAARKNGLEIWLWNGLFEFGSQGDASCCIYWPYQGEDNVRLDHPECVPINKYGTRKQGGPIEFAYPQARKIIVDRWAKYVIDKGYDGMVLYTYVENWSMRYEDEFGFNEPIVREFKKRYGVDIRKGKFDKEAWAKLRGEYVTQFMRELHEAFAKHGKKLSVMIEWEDKHLPMLWRTGGEIRPVGNIYLDWETWVKEGIIDEVHLFRPRNDAIIKRAVEVCRGTKCKVSAWCERELPEGVTRVIMHNTQPETGFTWRSNIGERDANTPLQPVAALKGSDVYAKRRILFMIAEGKQKADIADIMSCTKDNDLYVRRIALRALGKIGDANAVPAIDAALADPENSVRCQAAVILADFGGVSSIDKIFETVAKYHFFQFDQEAAIVGLQKIGPKHIDAIVKRVTDPDVSVRRVAVTVLQNIAGAEFPDAKPVLEQAALKDSDAWVRELALGGLAKYKMDPSSLEIMIKAMDDPDAIVQERNAVYITWAVSSSRETPFPTLAADTQKKDRPRLYMPTKFYLDPVDSSAGRTQQRVLELLVKLFKKYGDGNTRVDADYGWRPVGNAILCFGDEGEKQLKELIVQKKDQKLAESAWQVVYATQKAIGYCLVTEEEDAWAHAHHPFLRFDPVK